jgi:hypothetical protein
MKYPDFLSRINFKKDFLGLPDFKKISGNSVLMVSMFFLNSVPVFKI